MEDRNVRIELYFGEPLYFDPFASVNHILKECAENRQISSYARKGFLLCQKGNYFIPSDKALTQSEWGTEPIYYRYVDYHTDRDCLYYMDNACFTYVYHQYKRDVRTNKTTFGGTLLTQLCAMEVYILALVFGDMTCHKAHKFLKHYKDFTEDPLLAVESKDVKMAVSEAVKNLKSVRTEFECMEMYLSTVDEHNQGSRRNSKGVWHECVDIMKNEGLDEATITIFKDKLEIVLNESSNFPRPGGAKPSRRELYYVEFSDPKLSIKVYEDGHRVDIITQNGRYGILFGSRAAGCSNEQSSSSPPNWSNFVVLLFFYSNLHYPQGRNEPCPMELITLDGRSRCLHKKSCPLILEMPPVHYKLTRQDARSILTRYATQDGWYLLHTFEAPPKACEMQHTNGELQLSYCMGGEIHQITITFSQEVGFGPALYRTNCFRGKKFTTPFELISHFSIDGRQLHTFITKAMAAEMALPESVLLPAGCVEETKTVEGLREGSFYYPLTDRKHEVRILELPNLFWHGSANSRVSALEELVRSLCDTEPIQANLVRLFGLYQDEYAVKTSVLVENYGTCLHDYLREYATRLDLATLVSLSHHFASGLQALHARQIVHGFPVLHNCLIDPETRTVKLGGVGVLRLGIEKHRLDGESLEHEQPSFRVPKSLGEKRFHPARWLPKESLFDQQFTEETDRWCYGVALWQLFQENIQLPFAHISDSDLSEQLTKPADDWFQPYLTVNHPNEFLRVMLDSTIQYCLRMNGGDSVSKVVQLLDLRNSSPIECGYTFANLVLDTKPENLEELKIEEVNGQICFTSADICQGFDNYEDLNGDHSESSDGYDYGDDGGYNGQLWKVQEEDKEVEVEEKVTEKQEEEDLIGAVAGVADEEIILTSTIIGQGNFASVYKGLLRTEGNPSGSEVAVKIFHPEIKVVDIQKEIDAMQQLKHEYIIPLQGVHNRDGSVWLIMNMYRFGSLDKYIEQHADIPIERLCTFARQIAEGMEFLSNKNYIHRDLSTRNVLVQSHFKVRISDLGLSRSIEKQYYKHKAGVIPYLWYPPEFFETQVYGKSLDVWSYGITCCEIFNNAEVPYLNCDPPIRDIKMLKEFFDEGRRLAIPDKTPPVFKHIISCCWKVKAERWNFKGIVDYLVQHENVLQEN